MKLPVYLDNNATTAIDPRVFEAMLPSYTEHYGNPASQTHSYGWAAEELVKIAREQVADAINATPEEIYFTSGATESNNLALLGTFKANNRINSRSHIISCLTEHSSVLDPLLELKSLGAEISLIGVKEDGLIDLNAFKSALNENTFLASIMLVNNEIGVIQDLEAISGICKEKNIIVHTDATQALGKIDIDVNKLGVDLLSLSAHKAYGPKGVGAFYIRKKKPTLRIESIIFGGGHERGLRSGTLNVPGIVGLGKACLFAKSELEVSNQRISKLRDLLISTLTERLGTVKFNGSMQHRVCGQLSISFEGLKSAALIGTINHQVAISTSSACLNVCARPPHVLPALGISSEQQHSSIRLCIGKFNTEQEVLFAAQTIASAVKKLRG